MLFTVLFREEGRDDLVPMEIEAPSMFDALYVALREEKHVRIADTILFGGVEQLRLFEERCSEVIH